MKNITKGGKCGFLPIRSFRRAILMNEMRDFLREKMRSFGTDTYKQFLCSEVIHDWDKLVDENIAAQVRPVKIERGVLYVNVQNSAFKDQLKFFIEEILDAINEHYGQEKPLVKSIKIAKGFQIVGMPPDKISPASFKKLGIALEDITLTAKEIARCEEQARNFSNAELRPTVLATLLSQARMQKFRLANGWHKCAECETLCPSEEIFCEVCKIKARGAMVEELYRIFYDEPWLKTYEAQKLLIARMPQIERECSPDVVESARTSLIQKVASSVRYGDEKSPEVLKLVMLEKRLPPEKLTPAIIRRTLVDMQFNLADKAMLYRYGLKSTLK